LENAGWFGRCAFNAKLTLTQADRPGATPLVLPAQKEDHFLSGYKEGHAGDVAEHPLEFPSWKNEFDVGVGCAFESVVDGEEVAGGDAAVYEFGRGPLTASDKDALGICREGFQVETLHGGGFQRGSQIQDEQAKG